MTLIDSCLGRSCRLLWTIITIGQINNGTTDYLQMLARVLNYFVYAEAGIILNLFLNFA